MSVNRLSWLCGGLLAAGVLALAGGVVLFQASAPLAGEPPAKPQPPDTPPLGPKKLTVEEYRKKFPFVSIADRLAYEEEPAKELKKSGPAPKLGADALNKLDAADKRSDQKWARDMRRESLKLIHSEEAQKFIDRDGFGISRMPTPSVMYLELEPGPTLPFAKPGEPTDAEKEAKEALARGDKMNGRMPSLDLLGAFHQYGGEGNFASAGSLGYVKDRDHVAGFQPHQFRHLPELTPFLPLAKGEEQPKEKWLVVRLELVSLLKQKEPAVYVSKELPRMDMLDKHRTRPLNDFEGRALVTLREGEEIVTDATTNHIRMLGALRASKQCLECHQVRRGDLLGAFSYDIQRDPPIKAEK